MTAQWLGGAGELDGRPAPEGGSVSAASPPMSFRQMCGRRAGRDCENPARRPRRPRAHRENPQAAQYELASNTAHKGFFENSPISEPMDPLPVFLALLICTFGDHPSEPVSDPVAVLLAT